MDWLIKNELIPHGDSRLTRRGGFDPLWRIGITILIIYPRASPTAAGKPAANQDWTLRAGPSKIENSSPFNQNPNPKSFFQDFSLSQIRGSGSNHA